MPESVRRQPLEIVAGTIGRVADGPFRSQLPAKADPPHEIQQRGVLHHIGGGHHSVQDDPPLTTIDHVVIVIA